MVNKQIPDQLPLPIIDELVAPDNPSEPYDPAAFSAAIAANAPKDPYAEYDARKRRLNDPDYPGETGAMQTGFTPDIVDAATGYREPPRLSRPKRQPRRRSYAGPDYSDDPRAEAGGGEVPDLSLEERQAILRGVGHQAAKAASVVSTMNGHSKAAEGNITRQIALDQAGHEKPSN